LRREFFSGFNFTTASVVNIAAMIKHVFISFSAVQICDLSYIHLQNEVLNKLHHTLFISNAEMNTELDIAVISNQRAHEYESVIKMHAIR